MGKFIDLTGRKFGRLTVVERAGTNGHREATWSCNCECGNHTVVASYHLRAGEILSCGCYNRDQIASVNLSHGKCRNKKSKVYTAWLSMRRRCTNPNVQRYPNYGGRGINVCERWEKFENFYEDMGDPPGPEYSIDRIDPNGNYEPGNVRWASADVQANNKTTSRILELHNEKLTLQQWANRIGLNYTTILMRLKHGWTVEQALTTPVGKSNMLQSK